jgi:hypothetical protein
MNIYSHIDILSGLYNSCRLSILRITYKFTIGIISKRRHDGERDVRIFLVIDAPAEVI